VFGARPLMRAVGRQNTNEVYLMRLTVETEQEEDGRWIAEVSELAGVMKYGQSRGEAIAQAEALALRVIADRIEHGEHPVEPIQITFAAA
jgi:predicted RNase H-like HicB family nuclease